MLTPGLKGWWMRAWIPFYIRKLSAEDFRLIAKHELREWYVHKFGLLIIALCNAFNCWDALTVQNRCIAFSGFSFGMFFYLLHIWKMPKTRSAKLSLRLARLIEENQRLKSLFERLEALTNK